MRSFQRLWNALLCTVSPRKKFHRGRARNLAAVHWAVLESLELRTLFSALYWDVSSAPGLQAGSGTWSTSAANWNTAADGSGSQVAWTAGSDAVFSANGTSTVTLSGTLSANSITVSGTGYTLSGGTLNLASTSSVSTDLTLSSTTVNNSGTFTWSGGNLALGSHSTIGGSGTINLNGGSGTISQTNNWLGGSGTVNWSSGNVDFSGVSIFAVHGTFDGGDNTFDIHGGSSLDAWNLTWNSGDVSIDNLFVESGSWNFLTLNGGDYNWTITGTFQYDGGFFAWDSGTLNLNDALVKGTSSALSMTVPEGATLNVSGTFALNNATITNDGTINFDSTDTSALPDLTNDGTVIFSDPSVDLVSLTGSGTATEGSIYTLTIGSVSGDITDTITDYYVDWGDGTGLDDFTSAGGQTHVYAGSTDATTDYTITVHLVGAGTWVDTASAAVTVDDVAPVVTLDDPGTTTTAPTLTGTAGITPGDASTVTLYIYAGSSATGTPVDTESVDVDPDAGMFSYTVDSGSPLAPGTYTFQATQEEDAGNTSTSDPVTFTVALQDPGIVTNLVATPASPTEIDLSWDTPVAADYVTGFSVYRSTDYGQTFTLYDTASSSATGMNITGLDEDTDYMFNVVASNDTGDSPDNVTSASQPLLDIEAPTDLEVTPVDDGANGLELTWNDNSTGETSYEIEAQWGSNGQFATIDTIAANSTSYNTSNWMTSGIYVGWITEAVVFRVRAVGPGQSAYSDPSDPVNVAAATAFMNQDAVTDLSAAADPVSPGFDLTWSQTDVHSFDILYRKQGSVPGDYGAWTLYNTTDWGENVMPSTMTALIPAWVLSYTDGMQVVIRSGSSVSNMVTLHMPEMLTAPTLSATSDTDTHQYTFTWTAAAGDDSDITYTVYNEAATTDGSALQPHVWATSDPGAHTVTASWPTDGGYFFVVASDDDGDVAQSNVVDLAVPRAPTSISASSYVDEDGNINVGLEWNNTAYNEDGYEIQVSTTGTDDGDYYPVGYDPDSEDPPTPTTVAADEPTYEMTAKPDTTYHFRVRALKSTADDGNLGDHPNAYDSGWIYIDFKTDPIVAKVSAVSFSATNVTEFHSIEKDDSSGTYGTTQWQDNNFDGDAKDPGEADFPICYTRSGTADGNVCVKANVTVKVTGNPGGVIKVRATASLGYDPVSMTFAAVDGTFDNGKITATLSTTDPLPSTVDLTFLHMYWQVSYDGGATWKDVGMTANRIYITDANPLGTAPPFETELYIGCGAATGKSAPNDVLDADWAAFATLGIHRVDDKLMTYGHASPFAFTAAQMLSSANGRGQCTAWADLLVEVLGAQGIAATSTRIDPAAPYLEFRVKLMPAQGSLGANYLTTDFGFHQVVTVSGYPDRIYDPSYGTLEEKTDARSVQQKYEDDVVTALARPYANAPSGIVWIPDVHGIPHLIFTP